MDKKLEFNEALSALIEYATVNGNEITLENVHTYFDDILDSEDKFEAVYKYYDSHKYIGKTYYDKIENKEKTKEAQELFKRFFREGAARENYD